MTLQFKPAQTKDIDSIWKILQQAILRRKQDGSNQWQDGYPNPEVITSDINKHAGYVLIKDQLIVGYFTVLINDEPEYEKIEGNWLSEGDFLVVHRVAIADDVLGRGFARKIFDFLEKLALEKNIHSIKADTNFDNLPMLKLFESMGYTYCGEVYFRGTPRKAFEKILKTDL